MSHQRLRGPVITVMMVLWWLVVFTPVTSALDDSKEPDGANHAAAHVEPHQSTGDGVRVGVIEVGGTVNTAMTSIDNDGRLIKNLNFNNIAGPIVADPVVAGGGPSDHATQVTDVIGSSHATYTGVAPDSRLYVAFTGGSTGKAADDSILAAIQWYHGAGGTVGLFNMSFGGFSGGTSASGAQNQTTGGSFTLTTAGTSRDIVTDANRYAFTDPLGVAPHNVSVGIQVVDPDSGPGEFDRDNLFLAITTGVGDGAPLIVPAVFNSSTASNGGTVVVFATTELTPAQQATLAAKLTATGGTLGARIVRGGTTAIDDGAGNAMVLTNVDSVMSFNQRNNGGSSRLALALDWHMHTFDTLMIKSAGNTGDTNAQISDPGDFYNGITVGATDANFVTRAEFSSYWLKGDDGTATDVRSKPDILAPGTGIDTEFYNGANNVDGTSYAAPHVTGVAALLEEGTENTTGLMLGGTGNHNHLGIKAIILNSARKRFINEPENEYPFAEDHGTTDMQASDGNYLTANGKLVAGNTAGAGKTEQWTPTEWTSDGTTLTVTKPLDDEQGVGVLDAERALIQFDGGKQLPGPVTPIGWDINFLTPGTFTEYALDFNIGAGTFITATLDWDRIITESDGDNIIEATDTYAFSGLPDFDLAIFFKGNMVAFSGSLVDNVEHLHYPVPEFGMAGDYTLRVILDAGAPAGDNFYGFAWWTTQHIPEPATAIFVMAGIITLTRRRRA